MLWEGHNTMIRMVNHQYDGRVLPIDASDVEGSTEFECCFLQEVQCVDPGASSPATHKAFVDAYGVTMLYQGRALTIRDISSLYPYATALDTYMMWRNFVLRVLLCPIHLLGERKGGYLHGSILQCTDACTCEAKRCAHCVMKAIYDAVDRWGSRSPPRTGI